MPVTITITLSDDVARQAELEGLLSSDSLEEIVSEAVRVRSGSLPADVAEVRYPEGMDPRLRGAVAPLAFGRGRIIGDIISPIEVKWEAEP